MIVFTILSNAQINKLIILDSIDKLDNKKYIFKNSQKLGDRYLCLKVVVINSGKDGLQVYVRWKVGKAMAFYIELIEQKSYADISQLRSVRD